MENTELFDKHLEAIDSSDEMSNFDRELAAKLSAKITLSYMKEFAEWIADEVEIPYSKNGKWNICSLKKDKVVNSVEALIDQFLKTKMK